MWAIYGTVWFLYWLIICNIPGILKILADFLQCFLKVFGGHVICYIYSFAFPFCLFSLCQIFWFFLGCFRLLLFLKFFRIFLWTTETSYLVMWAIYGTVRFLYWLIICNIPGILKILVDFLQCFLRVFGGYSIFAVFEVSEAQEEELLMIHSYLEVIVSSTII